MIVATSLSNSVIGGPAARKNGIRFQAKYSSPLAAMRCYIIDNYKNYSGGTGGRAGVSLVQDNSGQPGTLLSDLLALADPQFPAPSSGRGKFPLFCLPPVSLTAGQWYWLVVENVDPNPAVNYFSMDYLMNLNPLNQVPDMSISQFIDGRWSLIPYLIPSPVVLHYANGLFQGLGWIAVNKNVLESGEYYGFPKGSCV